ncbi:MAG: N4-gp56 family major capsid protein [Candidatus Aminicenantes bacterium]|nr:MAG: N4-gp56 family major capsid protein [Candidatus Aminicenantes bacterium]
MRTIQELSSAIPSEESDREVFQLGAETNITKVATTSTTEATVLGTATRMTQFTDVIAKIGQDFRYLQNICNHNTQLVGSRDYGVRLFVEDVSVLDITQTHTEGGERTFTELKNIHYIDAAVTFKMGAIVISKEIASTAHIDLVEQAKYTIVQATEKDIEDDIITELTTASGSEVFGGDAATKATLETGDVLTPDVLADARKALRNYNYIPAATIIHPEQEGALMKDSQFVNAAEYGGREVILNGEIGKYVGTKIIVTTNIAAGAGFGATGKQCFMLGKNAQGQWPITIVWKEKPTYSYEFLKRWNNHYIYVDAAYDVELLLEYGVCEISVTNA